MDATDLAEERISMENKMGTQKDLSRFMEFSSLAWKVLGVLC